MYSKSVFAKVPLWLVWAINQFKPVQQSRQQALRAYCANVHSALYKCSVATFATGSALVHENNLHLYNDKYLMYHLMNFMLKVVKSIPNVVHLLLYSLTT